MDMTNKRTVLVLAHKKNAAQLLLGEKTDKIGKLITFIIVVMTPVN